MPGPISSADNGEGLAERALADPLVFAELVDHFAGRLLRFFVVMGISHSDADDLCQETFIRAWQARDRYDPRYALSTWIYTIGRRLAINLLKRRKPNQELQEHHMERSDGDEQSDLPIDGLWRLARTALKQRQYELLWLRYGEDMDLNEIAGVLGLSAVNARVSLHRARERFKTILHRERPELAEALDTGDAA